MNILSIIIKREFLAKVKNRTFIVMTFLSPLLFVFIIGIVAFVSTVRSDVNKIAIHDESQLFVKEFKNDKSYHYTDLSKLPIEYLKDSLITEAYKSIIYIPKVTDFKELTSKVEYISNDSPSMEYIFEIEKKIENKITNANYVEIGLDSATIAKNQADITLKLSKSTGEEGLKGLNEIRIMVGFLFGYLIMMFIIIYGNMVMRSVIEEKTNRIIEIIISSVKPFQLMLGKIIGTSFAGLLQFLIWAILGSLLYGGLSLILGQNINTGGAQTAEAMEMASKFSLETIRQYMVEIKIFQLLIYFLIFFIGGYFLYCSVYAAIGAAVDNETDSQQFLMPILMPLILAMYIGFVTVINEPHGTIATVFSIVPFTSPIVMLMRIPFGVPFWQIALSIVLLYLTFILMVWLASKIYRVGILMYGKKPTWKELYKWLKQA
jgi:ABC-2 type transport system permease protein